MAVVARRYAEALIKTAVEENAIEKYEEQIELLLAIVSDSKVKGILDYPGITILKKKEFMNILLKDKVEKYIVNFLMLLLEHRRHSLIADIVVEYKKIADKYRNVLFVEVTSAQELDKNQIDRLREKVKKEYRSTSVDIKTIIDPLVMGGIKLKIGDTVIDDTIKTRLESMSKIIKQNEVH